MPVTPEKETNVFFVGIKDPIEIRRSVLESLKGSIEDMQRFERFKAVREEKHNTAVALKTQVKEIHKLINKMKSELPKGDLRVKLGIEHAEMVGEVQKAKEEEAAAKEAEEAAKEAEKPKPKKKPKKEVQKEAPPKPKELSELEKLESELSNIESKLGKLA